MKFSLTLFLTCLIILTSSCSVSQKNNSIKPNLNLNIETSNKNKEIIIQTLLKDKILFSINFNNNDSFFLEDDILNSKLKYFCKSFVNEERDILEENIFKKKIDRNKKVLVIYSKNYQYLASSLKNKYPEEEYFLIRSDDYDSQIRKILNVDLSSLQYLNLSKLDKEIEIIHSPRVRNDIISIYFITNYDIGKTIVPIFRSYALGIDSYSSSEIFHDASDVKKLVDFENTFIPITERMIRNISKKGTSKIKNEIENTLIKDLLTIERIYQNNLFRENVLPDSGNKRIKRNGCINRDLNLWKVATASVTY